ncbi:MAG TPA: hypothetical protein VHT93_07285 [Pseudolabrys sp.]|nr:hypothetical protein [Pseudolabrys sp.]
MSYIAFNYVPKVENSKKLFPGEREAVGAAHHGRACPGHPRLTV